MTRFQLVFRDGDGDRVETHNNNGDAEPQVNGVVLVDGMIFTRRETKWLATREDVVDAHGATTMRRFICTPVPDVVAEPGMA